MYTSDKEKEASDTRDEGATLDGNCLMLVGRDAEMQQLKHDDTGIFPFFLLMSLLQKVIVGRNKRRISE
jgi:hypothetical protein